MGSARASISSGTRCAFSNPESEVLPRSKYDQQLDQRTQHDQHAQHDQYGQKHDQPAQQSRQQQQSAQGTADVGTRRNDFQQQQGDQQQYEAQQPGLGDQQQPKQGTAGGSAVKLQCPVSALLTLQRFEQHDKGMHSMSNSRWTVDCTSFYDFLRKNRDSVTTAFEVGVSVRGPQVARAVSDFEEAVTPGNNPAAYSMAGIVMVGFKQCGSKAVLGNARGLVKNTLYRSQDLSALIAEVNRDGVLDREVAEINLRADEMAEFKDFELSTEGGRLD